MLFSRLFWPLNTCIHDPRALSQDLVDQHLRDNKEHAAMQEVMGGTFAQQIICRSIPHRSEKDEEFYQASLSVELIRDRASQMRMDWRSDVE